jgi:hypothetical protein
MVNGVRCAGTKPETEEANSGRRRVTQRDDGILRDETMGIMAVCNRNAFLLAFDDDFDLCGYGLDGV